MAINFYYCLTSGDIEGLDKIAVEKRELHDRPYFNCINSKTGARGLQTEIERVLMPHMFDSGKYKKKGITELNIGKELIINPKTIL